MQQQFAVPQISKTMKWLLIALLSNWVVLQVIGENFLKLPVTSWLALTPGKLIYDGYLWQTFSYIFLHSLEVSHILLNLLMTWFLGSELEKIWGRKFFLVYFFGSGIGAGLIYSLSVLIWHLSFGGAQGLVTPVVGASGSVFGLMLAYGILFGDRTIHFMLLFPMKARVFVLILAAVEFLSLITHGVAGSGVANLAHLGGFISGYFILFWAMRAKRRSKAGSGQKKRSLKLVVNNEKEAKDKPKYWH